MVATRTECAAAAENEARRIVYRDTIRQLATKARTAAQRGPKSSVRAAPAAPAVHARAEVARQDTEAVLRTGGASTTTEPQPHYYWDDCVMVGLAMMPHCGT